MTYIKLSDRSKFFVSIMEVLGTLNESSDTFYIKGEYIGYFINRCF